MSTEKDILALEDRRCAAMTGKDFAALETLFHDNLVYTHSSAVVDSKASAIEAIRSGKTDYHRIERSDQKVQLLGDTALVTGRAKIEVTVGGAAKSLDLRFLDVWTKGAKGWQFIAWQSTKLAG